MKNIELNTLPADKVGYGKTKIRTYSNKVYANFCGLNVPDGVECESCTIISIDSLHVYKNKCYLQVYLDNCLYKIVDKQIVDYLNDNLFEPHEDQFLDF